RPKAGGRKQDRRPVRPKAGGRKQDRPAIDLNYRAIRGIVRGGEARSFRIRSRRAGRGAALDLGRAALEPRSRGYTQIRQTELRAAAAANRAARLAQRRPRTRRSLRPGE